MTFTEILRVVGLLGETFTFQLPWDCQIFQESQIGVTSEFGATRELFSSCYICYQLLPVTTSHYQLLPVATSATSCYQSLPVLPVATSATSCYQSLPVATSRYQLPPAAASCYNCFQFLPVATSCIATS